MLHTHMHTYAHRSDVAHGATGHQHLFHPRPPPLACAQSRVLLQGPVEDVAVCCSVLQCAAVCCSVLQCVAVCCSVLQCAAVSCSVLQCLAVSCGVLRLLCVLKAVSFLKVLSSVLQCVTLHCGMRCVRAHVCVHVYGCVCACVRARVCVHVCTRF